MANLKNIIKINQADYEALVAAGSAGYLINGVRYYYSEDNLYLIEGGTTSGSKYLHNVQIVYSNTYIATFSFINSKSDSYGNGTNTNWSTLVSDLNTAGFIDSNNVCPAYGQWYTSGKTNVVTGVYYVAGGVLGFKGLTLASTSGTTMTINSYVVSTTGSLGASATIYDVVTEL